MQTAHMRPFGLVDVEVMVDMADPIPGGGTRKAPRTQDTRRNCPRQPTSIAEPLHHLSHRLGRRCSQNTVIWFVVSVRSTRSAARVATTSPGVWIHGSGAREKKRSPAAGHGLSSEAGLGIVVDLSWHGGAIESRWLNREGRKLAEAPSPLGRPALVDRQATDSRTVADIHYGISGHIPVETGRVAQHPRCIVAVLRRDPAPFRTGEPRGEWILPTSHLVSVLIYGVKSRVLDLASG